MQAIYLLNIRGVKPRVGEISSFLDEKAIKKAQSYGEDGDKLRSLSGALMVAAFTAPCELKYGADGKPFKDMPPYFNLSHSGDFVGIFLCDDGEVGFDIQKIKPFDKKLLDYAFSEEEKAGVEKDADFALRWTMKEGAAKCVGTGILPLKKCVITDIRDSEFNYCGKKIFYKSGVLDGYAITACSFKKITAEILHVNCDFILKMLAKKVKNNI